jgi:5-(carboxyamino)imidazole ribonucleotide synthase
MSVKQHVVLPGSSIGMLGGGQLGRMFAIAARQCGYGVQIFGDPQDSPAGQVSDRAWPAPFTDHDALRQFAEHVDVVTYEQENIPVATVETLLQHVPVFPGPELLRASQHRLLEKTSLRSIGVATADFLKVTSAAELRQGIADFGGDAILKTVTLGYDGKGQARLRNESDSDAAWKTFSVSEAILEKVVPFAHELSIVASRFADGTCSFFAPVLNYHENHILDVSISPSPLISDRQTHDAQQIARAILEHFDVIGVLCVEFFATSDGQLLVNEIAPRPHNSGHLTINACRSSQFEQQLRAVCGLATGSVSTQIPAVMLNLLGEHLHNQTASAWREVFSHPEIHVHLYGKSEIRRGRKLGHLTVVGNDVVAAERLGRHVRAGLMGAT